MNTTPPCELLLDLRGAKCIAMAMGIGLRTLYDWSKSDNPPPLYRVGGVVAASSIELQAYLRKKPHRSA